jgi:hypothetical protein
LSLDACLFLNDLAVNRRGCHDRGVDRLMKKKKKKKKKKKEEEEEDYKQ